MHFTLVKILPSGVLGSNGLDDVILPVFHALGRLGFQVEIRRNAANPASTNILFGSCALPSLAGLRVPDNSVIFNLEQFTSGSYWLNDAYARHLGRYAVWDYSPRNVNYLHERLGVKARLARLGYVPEMTRLAQAPEQDIDVLFYGAVNKRRQKILKDLAGAKIRVAALHGLYGDARDQAIARAKIVLNVHYYVPASLEMARLGYLFANKKPVVSELREDTERYAELENVCAFCPYDRIAPTVLALLDNHKARQRIGEMGFEIFSAFRLEDNLKAVVGRRGRRAAQADHPPAGSDAEKAGKPGEAWEARDGMMR